MKQILRSLGARLYAWLRRQDERAAFRRALEDGTLRMGAGSYGEPVIDRYKGSEARVLIGKYCSISPGVRFVTGGVHPSSWVANYPMRIRFRLPGAYEDGTPATRGDIVVGSDVWIGTQAMILSGVTIGHGAIIAARAVVTRDIPPYNVAAGVPARVLRGRFSAEEIERLLAIAWWDWDEQKIIEAAPFLSSGQVQDFIRRYG